VLRAALLPAPLAAQQVLVRATDLGTGAPVPNALVSLVDGEGRAVDGGLTSDDGRRLLRAPAPGRYVVLVRRVGFRPERFDAEAPAAGAVRPVAIAVAGRPATLRPVVVREQARCGPPGARGVRDGEDGVPLLQAWEALQTALDAARAARDEGEPLLEARRFERLLTPAGRPVAEHPRAWVRTRAARAFGAADPRALRDSGWVWQLGEVGHVGERPLLWQGLDERVLASREFQEGHCFARVPGAGPAAGLVGIHFSPAPGAERPGVSGVVWMDTARAAPRWLDFVYVRVGPVRDALPRALRLDAFDPADTLAVLRAPGGRIEFAAAPSGAWVVRRWTLRTPLVQGGSLRWMREEGAELRFAEPAAAAGAPAAPRRVTVRGVAWDSLAAAPLAGAEVRVEPEAEAGRVVARAPLGGDGGFAVEVPAPGRWLLTVHAPALAEAGVAPPRALVATAGAPPAPLALATPSLATLRAALCPPAPAAADGTGPGVVAGVVRDSLGRAVAGAEVTVEWDGSTRGVAGDIVIPGTVARLVASGAEGEWRACGVPVGVPLRVRAAAPGTAAREAQADAEGAARAAARGARPPRRNAARPGAPARVGPRGLLWVPVVYEGVPAARGG
jgi:hypothetical protein